MYNKLLHTYTCVITDRGEAMDYLPIFLSLAGRRALVVGGGAAAACKTRFLTAAEADVTVVAPALEPEMIDLVAGGGVGHVARAFEATDVDGHAVVFAASEDEAAERAVSQAARAAAVPVNVVDRPDLSDFIMPAIVDRSPIVIGISSGGTAPVLARSIRADIERRLPAGLGRLARLAGRFRDAVKANIPEPAARRRFWEGLFADPVVGRVVDGDETAARERMLTLVNRPGAAAVPVGTVALVGAGPGDPDLLTVKAHRLLQTADVIVYDRLVGDGVLERSRRDATRICVGKAKGAHSWTQDEINAELVHQADAGKRVVRLKGGDPFVFGRGGEELAALRRAGIPVEIVPGITAATACAATAGIPLTHRGVAAAVTFVTGRGKDGEPDCDWRALATGKQTLVVYMGVSVAGTIAARLVAHGLAPATPVAIIENGTRPDERHVFGTVATLAATVRDNGIKGPAVIIIGDVAAADVVGAVPAGAVPADAPLAVLATG